MSLVGTIVGVIVTLAVLYIILSYYYLKTAKLTDLKDGNEVEEILAADIPGDSNSSNYTYSIWFNVDDWSYRFGMPKTMLSKTSNDDILTKIVLDDVLNNIKVIIGCHIENGSGVIEHECVVENFPIQRWTNLTISVFGRTLDMYIDGKLVRTCMLPGIAKTSATDSIYITPDGGFKGKTSNCKYWDNSSNPQQVYDIYKEGYTGFAFGSALGMVNKYGLKLSFMENDKEKTSYEF